MLEVSEIHDATYWNNTLSTLPYAHILQSWEWGEFKRTTTGWQPTRLAFQREGKVVAMASVLIRSVGPLRVIYIPKGPALNYADSDLVADVLDHLQALARRKWAVWLKIDPDVIAATGVPDEEDDSPNPNGERIRKTLQERGWQFSADQVQFRNTIAIDLTEDEDDILMAMSGNTRRKVRTAYKKDVSIRAVGVDEIDTLYKLYRITGQRDDFLIRPPDYYERAWKDFLQAGLAHALVAEYEDTPIAHVILFHFGQKCWYFYGASSNQERNRMPNYALQWEAIKWAKAQGYTTYDMWGAPDAFNENDSMWGVYQFKRGFRGTVIRHIGAWDYAPYPPLYKAYTQLWPRILGVLRRRNR